MAKQTRAYASTGKTIAVISGETHELITQFRVLGDTVSTSLIASRDGTRVFSRVVFPLGSDDNDDRIFTIDTRTNSVVNQLKLSGIRSSFGFIFDMAFDPAGRLLYVPGETIAVVDVATNTVARMLPLSRAVGGIAFDPDGTRLFAVGEDVPCSNPFRWLAPIFPTLPFDGTEDAFMSRPKAMGRIRGK